MPKVIRIFVSGLGAQARRYRSLALFAGGFESGDTSAWSASVP